MRYRTSRMPIISQPDRRVKITESCTQNSNARTVLETILQPQETVFAHYHTLFAETFTLLSGSITVYQNPSTNNFNESTLNQRAKALTLNESNTVPPNTLHKYLVGEEPTTIRVTLEPGNLDFERAMLIMEGTQREGTYKSFVGAGEEAEEAQIFKAVIVGLTNAYCVGEEKERLDGLLWRKGELVKETKETLLRAYAEHDL